MKKTIEQVEKILRRNFDCRDNDLKLVSYIWCEQFKEHRFTDFINDYECGYLTSESTIRRARRKVQELYPELRGKKWHERHAQQEPVKKELGYE